MVSDFQDYCCSNLENENMSNQIRKRFTEAGTERCSSNLCLAAITKIIEMPILMKESNVQSSSNEDFSRYIPRIFISVMKQLCYVAGFL